MVSERSGKSGLDAPLVQHLPRAGQLELHVRAMPFRNSVEIVGVRQWLQRRHTVAQADRAKRPAAQGMGGRTLRAGGGKRLERAAGLGTTQRERRRLWRE